MFSKIVKFTLGLIFLVPTLSKVTLANNDKIECKPANAHQRELVHQGVLKKEKFLAACDEQTGGSELCLQVIESNPKSRYIYHCTYGEEGPYIFIHPDESTWHNAFLAIQILDELLYQGVEMDRIYNWWRPEPYNRNVGGEAERHPFGTAVDVRFLTVADQNVAYKFLCDLQQQGMINAIGYYQRTPSIHMGVSDDLSVRKLWGPQSKIDECRNPNP